MRLRLIFRVAFDLFNNIHMCSDLPPLRAGAAPVGEGCNAYSRRQWHRSNVRSAMLRSPMAPLASKYDLL